MTFIPSDIMSFSDLVIGYTRNGKINPLLPPMSGTALKGELIAVIGRNGIGKSTLLRTLAGIQSKISGSVNVMGKNIENINKADFARIAGFISTWNNSVSNLNVYDLISLGRFPHTNWIGSLTGKDHSIIASSIERTSVTNLKDRYFYELSDGERQKVMFARLLAQDTNIMVMDEPTAFLDIRSKYEILHFLYSLTRNEGKTIIYSTHDFGMAIKHSDKIWLVLDKEMIEGAPEDLLINGAFDHLFESSSVRFNSHDGTYNFIDHTDKGAVSLKGNGKLLHWTGQALRRAGYTVTEDSSLQIIIKENKWQLSGDKVGIFSSVYDLIRTLDSRS